MKRLVYAFVALFIPVLASAQVSPSSPVASKSYIDGKIAPLIKLPAIGDIPARDTIDKIRERKTLLDFIPEQHRAAVANGTIPDTVDLSDALAKARTYVASGFGKLVLTAGVYPYSLSPNWAIGGARISCEGEVRFRYTGTGDAVILDSGAVTGSGSNLVVPPGKYDIHLCSPDNPLIVEAPSTAGHAVFMRAIHHSRVAFNVRGAGVESAALYMEFGVATDVHLTASVNQGGWYKGARPKFGFVLDARTGDPADYSGASYIDFVRPIIEGARFCGVLRSTGGVRLLGGTLEACTEGGLDIKQGSSQTTVDATDFEANNGYDIRDNGHLTYLLGVQSLARSTSNTPTSGVIAGATSRQLQIERGRMNQVVAVAGATNLTIDRLSYNIFGDGALTDLADAMLIRAAFNEGTGKTHGSLPKRTVLSGLPASASTGSPYRYTNAGRAPVTVAVSGGAVTQLYIVGGLGNVDPIAPTGAIRLEPGQSVDIAYTSPPSVVVLR